MTVKNLLSALYQSPEALQFEQVLAAIDSEFDYSPSAFIVGAQQNQPDENQGSCKVLYFAHQMRLSENHTLALFAEHYRAVLANPEAQDHKNIRQFIVHGWHKVSFEGRPLSKK